MPARPPQVVVLGATGEMGGRVVRLLAQHAPNTPCVGASRRGRHGTLAFDIHQAPPTGLIGASDVVIDVVGPYTHDPTAWVRACAEGGAHYIDLSERADFSERVHAAGTDSPCAVLSGCSTVPALAGTLLADMLARAPASDPTTRAEVLLSMGTRHPPSRGLVYSLLRPLGRPLPSVPGTRAFGTLTMRTLTTGVRRRYGRFPCSDLSLGCPARFWSGFDRALLVWALRLAGRALPLVSDRVLSRLCGPLAWLGGLARFFGSEPGSLRLERHSQHGLAGVMEIHAPTRGLDVPALPAVWAASRLVGQARSKARALGDVVPAQPQREALVAAGYRIDAWPPFDPPST